MKSPALPGVISLYVSSRGHISALTAAYEIHQILAADPRQHPTDRPVTPGSAPRTQRRTQANLRYDKRPRKTHPLTPTKQAAGSPRSGRVIRYGLRDGRCRGIDATKPQISLAVCTTILNAPGQTFYRPETLRNDSMPCATVLMRRFSDDVGDRFSSEPDEHSSEQTGLAPSHLQRCSDSSRRKQ
jgi:hypothetical protein